VKYKKGDLRDQKYKEYNKGNIVLFLLNIVLSLLVMLEFNFDLVLVFDEIELNVFNLFSFDDLCKLFEKVHLSCLSLHLSRQPANLGDLFLDVFLLKFEQSLQSLVMSTFSDPHEYQQKSVAC
jgi:hypothetical protein